MNEDAKRALEALASIREHILKQDNAKDMTKLMNQVFNVVSDIIDQKLIEEAEESTLAWIAVADELRDVGEIISSIGKHMMHEVHSGADVKLIQTAVGLVASGGGMGSAAIELAFVIGVLHGISKNKSEYEGIVSEDELKHIESQINKMWQGWDDYEAG